MSLPSFYVGTPEDSCKCGRKQSIPHCAMCGSFKVKVVKDPRRKPASARDDIFWHCEKCDYGFLDRDRDSKCMAPVYETKVMRLAKDINRARKAEIEGHPLTKKEEVLVPIAQDIMPTTEIDVDELPDLTEVEARLAYQEWYPAFSSGKITLQYPDFLVEKRKQKAEQLR
jgi:hypothetical protein